MSPPGIPPPLAYLRLIDQACEQFEDAVRAGRRPRAEDYLDRVPPSARDSLLRELQAVERELSAPAAPPGPDPGSDADAFRRAGFELLGRLGRGGMGVVYRARQLSPDRPVAIKVVSAAADDPDLRARFLVEAEAAARLRHPNIVEMYEIGELAGRPCLVLELVDGGTLGERLRAGPLTPADAASLVATLARAVQHAHDAGVVHRDLKPSNVLLASRVGVRPDEETAVGAVPDSSRPVPKITDFGLAKRLDVSGATKSGAVLGTPGYMAPEQARPGGKVGPAADVYGLGAVLYECLTGRPPFQSADPVATLLQVVGDDPVPPRTLRPAVPVDLDIVCLRCLEKDPGRRYPSSAALAEDLDRFAAGRPVLARPAGVWERTARWARRRPAAAALVAVVALVATVGFPLVTVLWLRAVDDRAAAVAARAGAETTAYYGQIAQADLYLRLNDVVRARLSLARGVPADGRLDPRGWEWFYLDAQTRPALLRFDGHRRAVQTVVVSPDGRRLATGGGVLNSGRVSGLEPGELIVWDASTGVAVRDLGGGLPSVQAVAFSPDGRRLAIAAAGAKRDQEGAIYVADLDADRRPTRLAAVKQEFEPWQAAFSPDGRHVAVQAGRTLTVVAADGGSVPVTMPGVVGFAFVGTDLVTFAMSDGIEFRDPGTGAVRRRAGGAFDPLARPALTPDGGWAAYVRPDRETVAVAPADRPADPTHVLRGHAGDVVCVAFGPDGLCAATGGADGTVRVWDRPTGRERHLFRGHTDRVVALAFSPDAARLYSAALDGTVSAWDLTRPAEFLPLEGPTRADGRTQRVEDLAIRGDGSVVAARLRDGEVLGWDLPAGTLSDTRPLPATPDLIVPGRRLALDAVGRRLAGVTARGAGTLAVWEVDSSRELFRTDDGPPVRRVAMSPDGLRVAAARSAEPNSAGEVVVWDVDTGRERWGAEYPASPAGLAFAPDGRRLAVALSGRPSRVEVWDADTGGRLQTLTGEAADVTAATFDAAGTRLAAAAADGGLTVWDVATGRRLAAFRGPPGLDDVAFSPDGRRLAAATREAVTLWDAVTGQEVVTIRGRPRTRFDPPFNPRVVFSPDGRMLAANSWDNTVAVWSAGADDRPAGTAAGRLAPWHLARGLAALEAGEMVAAAFHADRVRDWAAPGPWTVERGHLHARLGRWADAAADFARGFDRRPPDSPWLWHEYALALVHTGDLAGYRGLCRRMVAAFGPDRPFDTRRAVAFSCGLAPNAVADPAAVVGLPEAELARIPHSAPARLAVGLALYRAGRFADAADCCRRIAGAPNEEAVRAVGELVLGLSLRWLGETAEADTVRAVAARRAAAAGAGRSAPAADWYYWALYHLLLHEAVAGPAKSFPRSGG